MRKFKSITITIPAFNEEDSIAFVVKNSLKNLPKYFNNYEIIIVDDGSTDKTGEISDRFAKKNKRIRVIHQKNNGYSSAVLTGIKAATKEYIAYVPADGQFLVADMRHCFEEIGKSDLILGYRGGRQDYTTRRVIFSYGYLLLLLFLFDIKYMDVGWVNIWRTSKLKRMKLTCSQGIFILTEILVRFKNKELKIAEAPSYYHPRLGGEAKNAKLKIVFKTFLSAIKLWCEIKLQKMKH